MDNWYRKPAPNLHTRWSSFENPSAGKGCGALENAGGKGHAFDQFRAGQTHTLLDVQGSGTVRRMWFTIGARDPEILRAIRIDMYWDGSDTPAVSAPFGDFFCWILGHGLPFENELFASPEGKSFVCTIPMPFRTAARIVVTNESDRDLAHIFYDINVTLGDDHGDDAMYFHTHWRRERWTTLGEDFEILPQVAGTGRFLGSHIGVMLKPENDGWFGEGEAKIYLDGDENPSLVGTGTEDYIATGWGQGVFAQRYHGSTLSDGKTQQYGFYRYHIPDPVYFHEDCRVAMQQIGGGMKPMVARLMRDGIKIRPVSCNEGMAFRKFLEETPDPSLELIEGLSDSAWVNFYREDDFSAVAFFYLDRPVSNLPPLAPLSERTEAMDGPPPPAPGNEAQVAEDAE